MMSLEVFVVSIGRAIRSVIGWVSTIMGREGTTRTGYSIASRSSPPFGTIAILKGNLASCQVPFFRNNGPSG